MKESIPVMVCVYPSSTITATEVPKAFSSIDSLRRKSKGQCAGVWRLGRWLLLYRLLRLILWPLHVPCCGVGEPLAVKLSRGEVKADLDILANFGREPVYSVAQKVKSQFLWILLLRLQDVSTLTPWFTSFRCATYLRQGTYDFPLYFHFLVCYLPLMPSINSLASRTRSSMSLISSSTRSMLA